MLLRITILTLSLAVLVLTGGRLLRRRIAQYDPLLWTIVEFSWYMVSFAAVCVGLIELDRVEKLAHFNENEQRLMNDYYNKRSLLHAQSWLLRTDTLSQPLHAEGVRWFQTMTGLFDEGLNSGRWEDFLQYSRTLVFNRPDGYADLKSNTIRFGWPGHAGLDMSKIYLRDEISWMSDSLLQFRSRKLSLAASRPPENTNYRMRYVLVGLFLVALSFKLLKIYADYRRLKHSHPRR